MAGRKLRDTVRGFIRRILQQRLCVVIVREFSFGETSVLGWEGHAQRQRGTELLGGPVGCGGETDEKVSKVGNGEVAFRSMAAAWHRALACLALGQV